MNKTLLWFGLAKVGFGVVVGAFGVFLGLRLLSLLLRQKDADTELGKGNIAVGILQAASVLSLGLLLQHAVTATFDAMDLLYRGREFVPAMLGRFAVYATLHVGLSLIIGSLVMALGVSIYGRLTRGVDELAEVRRGNPAPALVLACVIVVLALVVEPGLRAALDGLLPLPVLPRDVLQVTN